MSTRYRFKATCPDCGLEVACNGEGKFRAHNGQLVEAGLTAAACYVAPIRKQEERDAAAFRAASAERRREYWTGRDAPSTLPRHLRGS